jgi:hypothetical protein
MLLSGGGLKIFLWGTLLEFYFDLLCMHNKSMQIFQTDKTIAKKYDSPIKFISLKTNF